MDKEEARFVLQCFRPDGADAADSDFAEALRLAAEDRELGEWLARERAKDAGFCSALGRLTLPDGLREEILAGLDAARGNFPEVDLNDASMIGALAAIAPPAGLREEILAAMSRSVPGVVPINAGRRSSKWLRVGAPLAAAAGIAMALFLTQDGGNSPVAGLTANPSVVPVSLIETSVIKTLESPGFALQLADADHQKLFEFIRKEGRMCPQGSIPKGLRNVPGVGCLTLDVEGSAGAIVCFREAEGNVVHLLVFPRAGIEGELPDQEHPEMASHGDWAVARWQDKGRVMILMGNMEQDRLRKVF